jgi:hypothetical protein
MLGNNNIISVNSNRAAALSMAKGRKSELLKLKRPVWSLGRGNMGEVSLDAEY